MILASEKRIVGIKGPTKEDLFLALSSNSEIKFFGNISDLPITMKIRGIIRRDSSEDDFILLCVGSSNREINGEYNTREKTGHLVYYQD